MNRIDLKRLFRAMRGALDILLIFLIGLVVPVLIFLSLMANGHYLVAALVAVIFVGGVLTFLIYHIENEL